MWKVRTEKGKVHPCVTVQDGSLFCVYSTYSSDPTCSKKKKKKSWQPLWFCVFSKHNIYVAKRRLMEKKKKVQRVVCVAIATPAAWFRVTLMGRPGEFFIQPRGAGRATILADYNLWERERERESESRRVTFRSQIQPPSGFWWTLPQKRRHFLSVLLHFTVSLCKAPWIVWNDCTKKKLYCLESNLNRSQSIVSKQWDKYLNKLWCVQKQPWERWTHKANYNLVDTSTVRTEFMPF